MPTRHFQIQLSDQLESFLKTSSDQSTSESAGSSANGENSSANNNAVIVISSDEASKVERTSASISSISSGWSDAVTDSEILINATKPVIDGTALGTLVVGCINGCVVGRAVTYAAQKQFKLKDKTFDFFQPINFS